MNGLTGRYDSLFLHVVARAVVPLIQVFALYVVTHGHYSPGGGFQGGVMLAASIILLRITFGTDSYERFSPKAALLLGALGALGFMVLGFLPMLSGGNFLEYGATTALLTPEVLRYWGIFWAEVFIGFLVWGSLVAIYDALDTGGSE